MQLPNSGISATMNGIIIKSWDWKNILTGIIRKKHIKEICGINTKQLYAMMQYSKYLKAGYTMIDIGDDNMCAALSPDGKELVIVAQNFGSDRTTTVDLGKFDKRGTAVCYRTSQKENCEEVSTQDVSGG